MSREQFAPREWIGTDPKTWGPIFGVSTRHYWPTLSTDGTGYFTSTVWKFRGPCIHHIDPCAPGTCSIQHGIDSGLDSYLSALAAQSGCWEDYCEWHRLNQGAA